VAASVAQAAAPLRPTAGPATPAARPIRRRRAWQIASLGTAIAAAAVFALVVSPRRTPAPDAFASLDAALGHTRPIEARFSVPGADQHRPVDVQRGTGSASAPSERLLELERELEQAKNWHGAAVVALLAGDREHAARAFAKAPATPEVESDRAVFELLDGSPAALERALEDADRALASAPNRGAAHWNRGLVLAAMNLPMAAAQEFDRVRALNEPGWADEAGTRAGSLRAQLTHRRTHWKQAFDAGQRLIGDGTAVTTDLADVSGTLTHHALRCGARRAVARARPGAVAARQGARWWVRQHAPHCLRAAHRDQRLSGPQAARGALSRLALGRARAGTTAAFLEQLARSGAGAGDIWLGTMVYANRVAAELDDYRRLATATGDPWFLIIAEHAAATAEIARGDIAGGEHRLRDALALARRERLAYRAIRIENDLVQLHKSALDLSQAAIETRDAYRDAVAAGEWVLEMNALSDLASIHHNRYAYGLARAYLTELAERAEAGLATGADEHAAFDCPRRLYIYESLANISMLLRDPERARAELGRAPSVMSIRRTAIRSPCCCAAR